jgi:flagellar motor switch protein FliN
MPMEPEIQSFFESWIGEFGRAVEMFSGETPALTFTRLEPAARQALDASQLSGRLWWKQPIEGKGAFASWTGAPGDCWTGIGKAVDESDPRRMYLDIVDQANKGTAAVLSAGFPAPLRCPDALEEDPGALIATFEIAEVKVVFQGNDLPSLFLALEPSAVQVLRLSEEDDEPAPDPAGNKPAAAASPAAPPVVSSPMMNRLMELRLPVSVLLGHTSIAIRDVLKLTPGSVIELDRKVGDYVEIVVHGTVVARGEIVSVAGNYGVRIKEVISREDRMALRHAA